VTFGGATMLKRFYLVALGVGFGLAMCLIPVNAASSFAATPESASAVQGVEQQQQPTSPGTGSQQPPMQQPQQMPPMGEQEPGSSTHPTHHQKQSLLTGKIAVQGGHYVFQNTSNNTTLRISNPKKAKKYSGDSVRVKGKVNEQARTIHISKIKPVTS
jgi:uncharacterized protein YdeI (BOF family)